MPGLPRESGCQHELMVVSHLDLCVCVRVCVRVCVCVCVCAFPSCAAEITDGSQYFVLLMITDGVISDMVQTKEAVVNVSKQTHTHTHTHTHTRACKQTCTETDG